MPSDYTRRRGGKLYLNLPIPSDLRPQFLTAGGKPRTHIVEALGTGDPTEGRRKARLRAAQWVQHFEALRKGGRGALPSDVSKAREFRSAMRTADESGINGVEALQDLAQGHAERIEAEAGLPAAQAFYAMATSPERLTVLEAVEKMTEGGDLTEGTRQKRLQQVRSLLSFLKLPDCLPDYVTEERAVAYVESLNESSLSKATKQSHLSGLHSVWRFLERKRQVPQNSNPWVNHEVTTPKPAPGAGKLAEKRGWKEAEILKLMRAPDDARAKHYTRRLFRELYALGFITGMRLDEIVSMTPATVDAIKGGYCIRIEEAKTEAGKRQVPVLHPAAVAILKRRLAAQKDRAASIFPECRPGGPDNKLSWQVQKAMGRDRDALGFGREVDFHSTRRNFMTIMENAGADGVHVQRYVGHRIPALWLDVYSDGASLENLEKVARAVRYSPEVEAEFRKAACLGA